MLDFAPTCATTYDGLAFDPTSDERSVSSFPAVLLPLLIAFALSKGPVSSLPLYIVSALPLTGLSFSSLGFYSFR